MCELIRSAFVEIRMLGLKRKGKQAAELADAFRNVPREMWEPDFALEKFRGRLKGYQRKYPTGKIRSYIFDVEEMIAKLEDPSEN